MRVLAMAETFSLQLAMTNTVPSTVARQIGHSSRGSRAQQPSHTTRWLHGSKSVSHCESFHTTRSSASARSLFSRLTGLNSLAGMKHYPRLWRSFALGQRPWASPPRDHMIKHLARMVSPDPAATAPITDRTSVDSQIERTTAWYIFPD